MCVGDLLLGPNDEIPPHHDLLLDGHTADQYRTALSLGHESILVHVPGPRTESLPGVAPTLDVNGSLAHYQRVFVAPLERHDRSAVTKRQLNPLGVPAVSIQERANDSWSATPDTRGTHRCSRRAPQ